MAGFRREPNVYVLHFEDEAMGGLVVRMRSVPIGQYMDVVELATTADETAGVEHVRKMAGLLASFASALVSWNLEEDGPAGPYAVPADIDGVRTQEIDFVMGLIGAWLATIAGVPDPLGKGSAGGGTAPAESPTTAAS